MNHFYSNNQEGGGNFDYSAPVIDILDVAIEKGFAQSTFDATDNTEGSGYDETIPDL